MAGSKDPAVRLATCAIEYVGRPTKGGKFLPPNDPLLDGDRELWDLAHEVLAAAKPRDPVLRAIARNPGAIGSAIRLLKFWAEVGADLGELQDWPRVREGLVHEAVMQSRETVRELVRINEAARQGRKP